jgi:NADH-quinone oxidoreductase subunit M
MTETFWQQQAAFPVLAALQVFPLLAAVLVYALREWRGALYLARLAVIAEVVLAGYLYRCFDAGSSSLQLAERLGFFGPLSYHAAADGVTVLFVLLSALMVLLITLYSMVRGLSDPVRLMAVILVVESVLMALLTTLNLFWFVVASAMEVGLVGYLLWYWATSPEKDRAMSRFFQFQGTGLLLLILGTLLLGWNHATASGGAWSFDLLDLAEAPVPAYLGSVIFFLLFYGLAIRTPLFPMHGWLPTIAHHGNVAIAPALLLGVKIGIYGMVRFVMPVVPEAVVEWHWFVAGFAAAGVFYAAILAFLQKNLRRLMAFAVVSHTSLVVIGLFALHPMAFQGSVLLAVNFGLAMTAMLFMTGFVYRRTRTTRLDRLGGLFDRIPFIAITFLVGGLAIVGMPGTPGFDAAHMVLEASIETFGALPTVAAALGNVMAAGFLLYAFQRAFLAPRPEAEKGLTIERALPLEYLVASIMLVVLLGTGFYLEPWQKLVEVSLQTLAGHFGH